MRTNILFKVATSSERTEAIRLQGEIYREELGYAPDDSESPVGHYLIALDEQGTLLATARLVGPEQRPFEIEKYVDLDSLLPGAGAIALAGRLCVHPDHRKLPGSMFILAGLLKHTYEFASTQGWTDLVIYPRTELVEFYRGALFEESGVTFVDPDFGLEMHVMRLELHHLERRLSRLAAPVAKLMRLS
jgi:predicted GNAT family N-acyltransferase